MVALQSLAAVCLVPQVLSLDLPFVHSRPFATVAPARIVPTLLQNEPYATDLAVPATASLVSEPIASSIPTRDSCDSTLLEIRKSLFCLDCKCGVCEDYAQLSHGVLKYLQDNSKYHGRRQNHRGGTPTAVLNSDAGEVDAAMSVLRQEEQ